MRKAEVKECRNRGFYFELQLIINNKPQSYRIEISLSDAALLKKGVVCEFEGNLEKLTKLFVNGQEITLIQPQKSAKTGTAVTEDKRPNNNNSAKPGGKGEAKKFEPPVDPGNTAKAPYNFIPINKTVVPGLEAPDLDRYHQGRHTGYINLTIEALTPLYLRDAYTEAESKKAADAEAKGEKWGNPDFFSPGGKPKIPGSSLRGMVRNLVEIVSYSRMEYVDDSVLYYRSMADECKSIRQHYFQNMGQRGRDKNKPEYKFKAGYLKRDGKNYFIIPAEARQGRQYTRIAKSSLPEFSFKWQNDGSCVTVSGPAPNNKKYDWLIYPADRNAKTIDIEREDLVSYKDDINRYTDNKEKDKSKRKDGDLLRWLEVEERKENSKQMVPCFYVTWRENNKQRVSFGHTAYFRLAYRLSIKDHLPASHLIDENKMDFTSFIFGRASKIAGRVFFEDAEIDNACLDVIDSSKTHPKILSNPKATTFQHYLEQGSHNKNELLHWDKPESLLRGHKLYWHRQTPQNGNNGWEASAEEVEKAKTQFTSIKPIKAESIFNGRIRFENLSDEELGALLFVLELPEGCAHKIGMGKPLGLGSVSITPELWISNRRKGEDGSSGRYEKLFDNGEWHLTEEKGEVEDFKKKFAKYILEMIRDGEEIPDLITNLWSVPRIKELKAMLYYSKEKMEQAEWLELTRYMEIERQEVPGGKKTNEFKSRPVLPTPSSIIDIAGVKYE